jgi:hypothetical protein
MRAPITGAEEPAMNTANLQLEGLYVAVAAITNALVEKGILSRGEVEEALRSAEAAALGGNRAGGEMSAANRDAVAFPARLLILANSMAAAGNMVPFSELARRVGATRPEDRAAR